MYREMKQTGGCYKLLNATGPVGSQGAQQQQQQQQQQHWQGHCNPFSRGKMPDN
jgi:hypothetical protein